MMNRNIIVCVMIIVFQIKSLSWNLCLVQLIQSDVITKKPKIIKQLKNNI